MTRLFAKMRFTSTKPATRSSTSSPKTLSIASNPAAKCYLVTIPPEVRDSILRYLLLLSEPDDHYQRLPQGSCLYFEQIYPSKPLTNTRVSAAGYLSHYSTICVLKSLALTCKLLYFESVALFYASHSFGFDSTNSLSQFLRTIGPGRRQHIRDIDFVLEDFADDNKQPGIATTLLSQCNLKRLRVRVSNRTTRTLFTHDLFRAAGVKKLREIRGCEDVYVEQIPLTDHEARYGWELKFTEKQVKEFERVLREELCREREQPRDVVKEIVVEVEDENSG